MAILNRDLDSSQQKDVIHWTFNSGFGSTTIGTGFTLALTGPIPYPYTLQSINALALGLAGGAGTSGAPQLSFNIMRVIPGGGVTMIAVSISSMVIQNGASFATAYGYSGTLFGGYSGLAATGSTLLLGLPGDIISATTAVANTACQMLTLSMVLKKVQDTVTMVSNAT